MTTPFSQSPTSLHRRLPTGLHGTDTAGETNPDARRLARYLANRAGERAVVELTSDHLSWHDWPTPSSELSEGDSSPIMFYSGPADLPRDALQRLALHAQTCPYVLIASGEGDHQHGLAYRVSSSSPGRATRPWLPDTALTAGFPNGTLLGRTVPSERDRVKTTELLIAGTDAVPVIPARRRTVAAVIHAFNEVDVIGETVSHLNNQGLDVHVADNWSTDGTWELLETLRRGGRIAALTRFPQAPTSHYEWAKQLQLTEFYARSLDADWIVHYDADELRYSPWPGVTLRDAISFVDSRQYNAVDFTVLDFRYTGREADFDSVEQRLTHFEFGRRDGHFKQIKAWRNSQPVDLHSSGGHEAAFAQRRVFPLKFLTKHYPLRSPVQAENKIFRDRATRIMAEKRSRGWHSQYDDIISRRSLDSWDETDLLLWSADDFASEYLIERISGIGIR